MGNSGNGLAVFGLIIALIAVALGGYSAFTIFTAEDAETTPHTIDTDTHSIKWTWYDTSIFHQTTSGVSEYINGLEVEFTVNAGENIYILYNSYIKVEGYVGYFNIHIDGLGVGYQMQVTSDDASTFERFPIALQHYIPASDVESTIGYGNHTVSIYAYSTAGLDTVNSVISQNSLFVQTFS